VRSEIATECVQRAGEIMFLPQFWWHATWNDGITVGIGGQMHSPGLHRAAGGNNVTDAEAVCAPYGQDCWSSVVSTARAWHVVRAHDEFDRIAPARGVSTQANIANSQGRTPMHSAAAAGSVQVLDWLFKNGMKSDMIKLDKSGQTPLIHAAQVCSVASVASVASVQPTSSGATDVACRVTVCRVGTPTRSRGFTP
jgi:hypothetical protein